MQIFKSCMGHIDLHPIHFTSNNSPLLTSSHMHGATPTNIYLLSLHSVNKDQACQSDVVPALA